MKNSYPRTCCIIASLLLVVLAAGCTKPKPPPPVPPLPENRICIDPVPGPNLRVSYAPGESNSPVILWDGSLFRVAWWDLRSRSPMVYHMKITETARRIGRELRVFNEGSSRSVDMAFDGRWVVMAWDEDSKLYLLPLGDKPYPPELISENGDMVTAGGWNAAAWVEKDRLLFTSWGVDERNDPVTVAHGVIHNPQLIWSGKQYAVVWAQNVPGGRDIIMQRIDPAGRMMGQAVRVSSLKGLASNPQITWNGKEYGIAWTHAAPMRSKEQGDFQIYFARVAPAGNMPISTRSLDFFGSADQVSLASSGGEYAVAWVGADVSGSAVYFQRLNPQGEEIGETQMVNDGSAQVVGPPDMAWNGKGYGVAWHDDRVKGDTEIFFSFVACSEAAPAPEEKSETAEEPEQPPAPAADAGSPGPVSAPAPDTADAGPAPDKAATAGESSGEKKPEDPAGKKNE